MSYYENDLWETKEISRSLTMGGSASHTREIVLRKEMTVKDFIEAVININDGHDWGRVYVNGDEVMKFNIYDGTSHKTEINHSEYLKVKDAVIKKAISTNEWNTYGFKIET